MTYCVSIPHRIIDLVSGCCDLNSSIKSEKHMVKQVLAWAVKLNFSSSISAAVWPKPFGYCSETKTGMSITFAACSTLLLFSTTWLK